MQQFQVPQFIAIEDRIIGPLTLRQFLYVLGAAGILALSVAYLGFAIALAFSSPLVVLFLALAFYTVDGRPFSTILPNMINYYLRPRLYLWRKESAPPPTTMPIKSAAVPLVAPPAIAVPKLTESRLSDLAWSLDIRERMTEHG